MKIDECDIYYYYKYEHLQIIGLLAARAFFWTNINNNNMLQTRKLLLFAGSPSMHAELEGIGFLLFSLFLALL